MSDTAKVMDMIKEHDVKFVDFRFTDPRGKWQHLAHHVRTISEDFLDGGEGPYASTKRSPAGNAGHRPPIKGGYFPVPPVDAQSDLRAEMLSVMHDMGLLVEKHHHEVAPSQAELGAEFATLVRTADNMQIYKYVVHNVAHQYGKTATFMPKPIKRDNGSRQHVHQS